MNYKCKIKEIENGPIFMDITSIKNKWATSIGDLTIYHISHINWWKRFWLRFMGWKVIKLED